MINYNYNGVSSGYTVTQLFAQTYYPVYKGLVRKRKVMNTVIYVLSGELSIATEKRKYCIGASQAIFLPIELEFVFTVLKQNTECIQIEFAITKDSKPVKLCDEAMYLKSMPAKLDSTFRELPAIYSMKRKEDEFSLLSLLYSLIGEYFSAYSNRYPSVNRISKAVEYLNSRYTEAVDIDALAQMCGLSVSQFRRLFVSAFGMSPVKYKNMLRLRDACNMLALSDMNVGEIAQRLGFDDIYAFSHAFKKEYGCSPTYYRTEQSKNNMSF